MVWAGLSYIMLKFKQNPPTDVGVIIARFQVPELHEAHKELIETVLSLHDRVIIMLGVPAIPGLELNPLSFESRKRMIEEFCPKAIVLPLADKYSDEVWSRDIDKLIATVCPTLKATLYGSRDSFIPSYKGRHQTQELESDFNISGTEIRSKAKNNVIPTKDFRCGELVGATLRWPSTVSTVDIAIFNDNYSKLLLGRKHDEELMRFIGGYIEPGHSAEHTARKEAFEETGLTITDPEYINSCPIDDWRYRGEKSKILTFFFAAKQLYGSLKAGDDIAEVRWYDLKDVVFEMLVKTHHPLYELLCNSKLPLKLS
jgi:bifunctional NMN adenylyltransferase/nudix hydrolase